MGARTKISHVLLHAGRAYWQSQYGEERRGEGFRFREDIECFRGGEVEEVRLPMVMVGVGWERIRLLFKTKGYRRAESLWDSPTTKEQQYIT